MQVHTLATHAHMQVHTRNATARTTEQKTHIYRRLLVTCVSIINDNPESVRNSHPQMYGTLHCNPHVYYKYRVANMKVPYTHLGLKNQHGRANTYMYYNKSTLTHTHTHTLSHTLTHTYTPVYTYTHANTYTHTLTHNHTRIHVLNTHTYTHTHT